MFHYFIDLTEHGEAQLDEIFQKQLQKKLREVDRTDRFISLAISVLLFEKARKAGVKVKSDVITIFSDKHFDLFLNILAANLV